MLFEFIDNRFAKDNNGCVSIKVGSGLALRIHIPQGVDDEPLIATFLDSLLVVHIGFLVISPAIALVGIDQSTFQDMQERETSQNSFGTVQIQATIGHGTVNRTAAANTHMPILFTAGTDAALFQEMHNCIRVHNHMLDGTIIYQHMCAVYQAFCCSFQQGMEFVAVGSTLDE